MSALAAGRLLESSQSTDTLSWEDRAAALRELENRITDEMESILFLYVPRERVPYYDTIDLFGANIRTTFPSITYDVEEAGKCFALGRYTACVFHLMRIMETGIRATARCLGIPDPIKPADRNWGRVLEKVKEGIAAKWPTQANRRGGDGALFETIFASLDAVKNPWRNATMHPENKYTQEEAEDIFRAVRSFMKSLSSRMDENGQPVA
jgi:hypothetical protein